MRHWKKNTGFGFKNSDDCYGFSYDPQNAPVNIAVITVKSRYPESGYAYNKESHEMAYVANGVGSVEIEGKEKIALSEGDVVYFEPNERLAWDGDMTLVVPCSPAFQPEQHILTGDKL